MLKMILLLILGSNTIADSGHVPQAKTTAKEELTRAMILERVANTSPEGLEVIKKAKGMTPEIQKYLSAKSLGEAVEDCVNGRCQSLIYPIGWEAVKGDGPLWRISFYFQDDKQSYVRATWEYNEEREVLVPIEPANATKFWVRRTKNFRP